jgi:hypothetical protein
MAVKRSIMLRDTETIDLEIARLWAKYRATNCSSAVLLAIDALLDQRHQLVNGGEMTNPLDIAAVSEYGPADLGDAA